MIHRAVGRRGKARLRPEDHDNKASQRCRQVGRVPSPHTDAVVETRLRGGRHDLHHPGDRRLSHIDPVLQELPARQGPELDARWRIGHGAEGNDIAVRAAGVDVDDLEGQVGHVADPGL
eukprot:763362-Hanusia_phi.AAC.2